MKNDIIYFKRKKTKRKLSMNKTKKNGGSIEETPSFFIERFNNIKYSKHQEHNEHI